MSASFTEGSINRLLITMTASSVVGMLSLFSVALVDMFFLSLLDNINILAGVGFASSLLFICGALGIGFSVTTGVLVSQAIGRGGKKEGSEYFSVLFCVATIVAVIMALLLWSCMGMLLDQLGASAAAKHQALLYMMIVLPTMPLATLGMVNSSGLRCAAAPVTAMKISLLASLINLILDPILIFGLDLGLQGAALATVSARIVSFLVGVWVLKNRHQLLRMTSLNEIKRHFKAIFKVAGPALLTNLATPISGILVMMHLAPFGSETVAGSTLVSSLTPLIFAVFFSLSGSAGPIIGQNIGAQQFDRVSEVIRAGIKLISIYTLFIWALLAALCLPIIALYGAEGDTAAIIKVFCYYQIPLASGLGFLALANTIFNNCGRPLWSTGFNVLRSTLATWLFCHLGAILAGAKGVLIGSSLTMIVFGLSALWLALRLLRHKTQNSTTKQIITTG